MFLWLVFPLSLAFKVLSCMFKSQAIKEVLKMIISFNIFFMTGYKGKDALLTNSCSNRQNQRNSMKSSMKTFFLLCVCVSIWPVFPAASRVGGVRGLATRSGPSEDTENNRNDTKSWVSSYWNFAPNGFANILNENNQMNTPDVICKKEQQIELLNQTSRMKRSPKAQLYH